MAKDEESFTALAFKVMMDEGRKLVYLRIYSGVLKVGTEVYNPRLKKGEKISRIFQMHAHQRTRVEEAKTGEIVAVMGLKETTTGDTLCDRGRPILLEPIDFYKPVMSVAVEPRTSRDQEKLTESLEKLSEEDPTFHVKLDEDTGQTIISGMGELHLDVLVNRLLTEYHLEVNVGRPQVVYRETVEKEVEASAKFMKEMEEIKHFAEVFLRISPNRRGKGIEFHSEVPEGTLSPEGLLSVEEGIKRIFHGGSDFGLSHDGSPSDFAKSQCGSRSSIHACSQDCFLQCLAGRLSQGPTCSHGTDDGGQHHRSRRVHGRSGGGFEGEEEFCGGHHPEGEGHDDQSHLPPDPNVRLLNRFKIPHPGKRDFLHAIFPL